MQSHPSRASRWLFSVAASAAIGGVAWIGDSPARGDSPVNRLARWTGWGWSEGYHSAEAERDPRAGAPPIGYSALKARENRFQPVELARPRPLALGNRSHVITDAFLPDSFVVHSYRVDPAVNAPPASPGISPAYSGTSILKSGPTRDLQDDLRTRSSETGPTARPPHSVRPSLPPKADSPGRADREPVTPSPSDRQTSGQNSRATSDGQSLPPTKAVRDPRKADEARSFDTNTESTWQRFLRQSSEEWFPVQTESATRPDVSLGVGNPQPAE